MQAFEECHARGFLWKVMGMCNGLKDDLRKCLRKQREQNQLQNREQKKDQMDRIRKQWKEVDENS